MRMYSNTHTVPLDWNSPCCGEVVSTQVRQGEELNWASQLKSSDQRSSQQYQVLIQHWLDKD